MESGEQIRIVRFGAFEADLQTGELRKDGKKLALQGQPFQVLAILLRHPGQLITREQLRAQIWQQDTFVDFDHALNTAITKIRLALGDDAERPRYIETLPRRGYRFIGPVPEVAGTALPKRATSRKAKPLWMTVVGLGTVVILLLSAGLWRTMRKSGQPALPPMEIVPLVALHGGQADPAFSPDGNQVAYGQYEHERDGVIYTTLIDGDKPLRLTEKPGVCCPAWSPDNRQIAFFRFMKDGLSINVIPALGGAEKRLYSSKSTGLRGFCARLDWSPDGKLLAFDEATDTPGAHVRIALISLDDLGVRALTTPPQQEFDCEPAFSPDGSQVVFERGSVGGFGKDLFLVPITGGTPRRLTFDNAWSGTPVWTKDGSEIVFASMLGGPMNLWRIPAKGGAPQAVAGISAFAYRPSIPRKGNLLAYEHFSHRSGIWQIRLMDKTHAIGSPTEIISTKGFINWRPNYSADGKQVVFESDRLGHSDIWYCRADGTECRQLTSLRGTAGTARWSPDGLHVAFEFQSQHYYDIYVMDVDGGLPRRLPTFRDSDNGAPNWSRDGRWIYFYSSHEKGPFQLWKVPFQGGTPVRITTDGGVYAAESVDGRSLYYSKLEQPGIWRIPLDGGKEERVLEQPGPGQWFNWALSRAGLYFVKSADDDKQSIEFFDFATHKRTPIVDGSDACCEGLALAPDGKSLLYVRTDSEDYEIMMVKNFH